MVPDRHVIADERYVEKRKEIDHYFVPDNRIEDTTQTVESPFGHYRLEICQYKTGPNSWNFSRGIITRNDTSELIAEVKRNYGRFWHAWVQHSNGNDYLLCGEDYQGYTVLNLTTGKSNVFFPDSGLEGFGFCWAAVHPAPDGLMLAVDGCYWACPYEVVFYDFRQPENLPLHALARIDFLDDCQGWRDNDTFVLTREIEIRKSDGVPYDSLTAEEQDRLDKEPSLVDYRKETVNCTRPPFAEEA